MDPLFRILGPLEVRVDERLVPLGGRRERALLAILLLNIGEVVSVERLIDGIWGEARPSSAKHMVHEYVSRLRTDLGDVSPITTRTPGYMLEPAGEVLDVHRFVQLTTVARQAAREQRHQLALGSYDQALALWRGDALADVALEGHAQIAATRLDQERRLVGEERVDCALALGEHLQLIPELEHRVEEAPLRERSRRQLILALYRAGRQTEALERYREGRTLLVEHAGIEPGRELRQLERAILTQDPALELTPPRRDEMVTSGTTHIGRRRATSEIVASRRWLWAGILGMLLAVAAVVILLGRGGSRSALARIDANSAGAIDPGRNRLVAQVRVGAGPGRVATGFGSLWVVNNLDNTVSRIDPAAASGEQTITVDGDPTAIAVGDGFVWVACSDTRKVDVIDPRLNRRVQRVQVGNGPSGIAIDPETVWVTNRLDDSVTEIDSKTGHVRGTLNAGQGPSDVVYGFGALWIANESSSTVTRLDPDTGGLQEVGVQNRPAALAIGFGSVWVANSLDGTVSRIDPSRNSITSLISVGSGPSSLLAADGSIWVSDSYSGRIVRIDPETNTIVGRITVGSEPQSLASIGGRIWLSARETATVNRGGTLRLFDRNAPESLDAGAGYGSTAWTVFSVTGDGLVGFKRVGGLDGGTLVPDLATSLPEPTDRGLTYTFQLRRGIRYSNGEPVHATDVRRALERDLRINPPGVTFYGDLVSGGLVGADACSKTRCDLSRGVVANDRMGTITLHLRKPDPELFYKLALPFAYPVPPSASMTGPTRLGVPGTGPYKIQSWKHSRLVLVRNPHFKEWSAAAQPDGHPDRIVATYNDALNTQLTAVELGKSDLMSQPPDSRLNEVQTRFAAQAHAFPTNGTFAIFLNTRLPPFNKRAVRQAFNYAIDRNKAVARLGGSEAAAITCQTIPAGTTGYRPYCPYTRDPTGNRGWAGSDLTRARKLIASSGTLGQTVIVRTSTIPDQLDIGELAVATLKQLGYRASLKVSEHDAYYDAIFDSRTRAQAGFFGWFSDYPAASSVLLPLTCRAFQRANKLSVNASEFCNRHVEQGIDRALALQSTHAPAASNATWAGVDRLVTDLAPWVPLVNPRVVVIVSRRVRNVQSNPQWGVLIDQIWLR